jgi:hypothetical protein
MRALFTLLWVFAAASAFSLATPQTSVITSKAANGYHFKTGQQQTPRT